MRGIFKRFFLPALIFLSSLTILFSALNIYVISATEKRVLSASNIGGNYDCILVLGAGLRADGSPSDMLEDRLYIAIALYRLGRSEKILLSGDRSGEHYDEVGAMKKYCIQNGIPENDIITDTLGFSTYESIYNARALDGFERIIIVSQSYHLYRAVYIADKMGFDAVGASADVRKYSGQLYRDIREGFARIKDIVKVNF